MPIPFKTFCCFLLLAMASAALAQERPRLRELNADLPDETEETSLLNPGEFQAELAFLHAGFDKGSNPSIGQALLRYGLLQKLELRVLAEDGYARDRYFEQTVESTYPLSLGAKIALLEDHRVLPDITFVGYLELPFTAYQHWSPLASLAFKHELGQKWKLEYNGGGQQEAFGTGWSPFFNSSLHYKPLDRLELFAEYYGQYPPGEEAEHNAGLGIFFQLSNALGIYSVAGQSIAYDPANYFVSLGMAFRLNSN